MVSLRLAALVVLRLSLLLLAGSPLLASATVLESAARGDAEGVKRGIGAREDLEARDERGWTALMLAAARGNSEITRVLLDAGADPNTRASEGSTPLMAAAVSGHVAVVQLLIQRGADPTLTNDSGATAQLKAQQYGHADLATLLKRSGEAKAAQKAAPPRAGAPAGAKPAPAGEVASAFDVDALDDVYVLVEDATFRKQPSMGAPVAGQMPMGLAVRVTGKVRGRDWYRVGPAQSGVFVPGQAIRPKNKAPDVKGRGPAKKR